MFCLRSQTILTNEDEGVIGVGWGRGAGVGLQVEIGPSAAESDANFLVLKCCCYTALLQHFSQAQHFILFNFLFF